MEGRRHRDLTKRYQDLVYDFSEPVLPPNYIFPSAYSFAEELKGIGWYPEAGRLYFLLAVYSSKTFPNSNGKLVFNLCDIAQEMYVKAINQNDGLGRTWIDDILRIHYQTEIEKLKSFREKAKSNFSSF